MSNQQETIVKETSELLENAQKEVLKAINNQKSFFARLFSQPEDNSLRQAQSIISKALNQMKGFSKDESSLIIKLQNHLNEKSNLIKNLENQLNQSNEEKETLLSKIRLLENSQKEERQTIIIEKTPEEKKPDLASEPNQELETKFKNLERDFQFCAENLEKSQNLVVEFYKRLKRLKAEITAK